MVTVTSDWLSAFWIIFSNLASNLSTIAMLNIGFRPCCLRLTLWMAKRLMVLAERPSRCAILAALRSSSTYHFLAKAISVSESLLQVMAGEEMCYNSNRDGVGMAI